MRQAAKTIENAGAIGDRYEMRLIAPCGSTVSFEELPVGAARHAHVHGRHHGVVVLQGRFYDGLDPAGGGERVEGRAYFNAPGTAHLIEADQAGARCVIVEFAAAAAPERVASARLDASTLAREFDEARRALGPQPSPAATTLRTAKAVASLRRALAAGEPATGEDWLRDAEHALAGANCRSIQALSARLGRRRSVFARAFHERTGLTPRAYRLLSRLDRAAAALVDGANGAAAAAASGFTDQAHLNRAWRRYFGGTPLRWSASRAAPNVQD